MNYKEKYLGLRKDSFQIINELCDNINELYDSVEELKKSLAHYESLPNEE